MMSHAADTKTHMDPSQVWASLSENIDRFYEAWQEASDPPQLAEFLPAGPPNLRRLTLIEIIKVDLEQRWQQRRWPKLLEQYMGEFPELSGGAGVPCDLVYEEYHIRKQQGDDITLGEYRDRFPTRADELARLLNVDAPTHSTLLVEKRAMPTFEPGQTIDDFELLSPLGKGAFASVFRARQTSMHRIVALKISRDRSFEPQTLAQLEHPHIVRVYDQRQFAEGKLRLLYMQYVPGGTLHSVLEFARARPTEPLTGATFLAAIDAALVVFSAAVRAAAATSSGDDGLSTKSTKPGAASFAIPGPAFPGLAEASRMASRVFFSLLSAGLWIDSEAKLRPRKIGSVFRRRMYSGNADGLTMRP